VDEDETEEEDEDDDDDDDEVVEVGEPVLKKRKREAGPGRSSEGQGAKALVRVCEEMAEASRGRVEALRGLADAEKRQARAFEALKEFAREWTRR
jgi:hypothetical protein